MVGYRDLLLLSFPQIPNITNPPTDLILLDKRLLITWERPPNIFHHCSLFPPFPSMNWNSTIHLQFLLGLIWTKTSYSSLMAGKREGLVLKGGAHSALQGSPRDLFAHNCPPRPDCAQPAHHHHHHHHHHKIVTMFNISAIIINITTIARGEFAWQGLFLNT